jgi:hypothetical protein|tara:strand:+ start:95541 stop:96407 length:867 start_codon:yes stop_codon:yes gene_type:complete
MNKKAFLQEVKNVIENKSLGLYVGAGLSMGAGLPSWKELLLALIKIVEDNETLAETKIAELKNLVKYPSKYLMLAEELREIIPQRLPKFIKEKFDDKNLKPNKVHEYLLQVKSNFIITTNYDTLIEKAFVKLYDDVFPTIHTYKNASSINYNLWNKDFFILKAHGDAKNSPNDIVLTEKDYRKIIYNQRGYQSVLHAIFSTHTIVLLGISLSDPELLLMLGYIHNIFHGGSPTHYALVDKNSISNIEIDRWRKDFNIECIKYDSKDNHIELENILKEIVDQNGKLELT